MSYMKPIAIHTTYRQILADTLTPVSMFRSLRRHFGPVLLLESSDYHGDEHTMSYLCFGRQGGFRVQDGQFIAELPGHHPVSVSLDNVSLAEATGKFMGSIASDVPDVPCLSNGLFGYMTYDTVQHFEQIRFRHAPESIPLLRYDLFRYVIALDHFSNQMWLFTNDIDGQKWEGPRTDNVMEMIRSVDQEQPGFALKGEKSSNISDAEYVSMVKEGIRHCYRGDVFQIVLSRRYEQGYEGDDFQLYRALRSINPSPYLFYFDYGDFRLMGSSPEAQLIIRDDMATIHPIAGTFRRTGNDQADADLAEKLVADPKENAEHIMLVDLARNDLSRHGHDVNVKVYREVQYYSHVIHLVSKVCGKVSDVADKVKLVGDTFPAGTLSGAPKYKAMQIIDTLENRGRGFYGGCIGYWGFNGDFNHAIMIRTFLSQHNRLSYQAGAGVVADSIPESELQEVENKLAALNKAVEMAQQI